MIMVCFSFHTIITVFVVFFFNDTATTEIYTLSLHDALPISFLDQNIHEQRKTLATNPTPLFKSLIQVLNHVQTDLSLMGYLLPLVDGILFGDLFEY